MVSVPHIRVLRPRILTAPLWRRICAGSTISGET
jgi:hypothetical protein